MVEPGGTYYLKIEEPPRNVVFLWDTSASVGAYLPVIYNSLMAYMEDVVPGRDAANLIPFGGNILLRDWYGEPYILQTVLNDYPRKENSSEAEKTLHTASKALAPRAGTKAIVMVTDAATNRYASGVGRVRTGTATHLRARSRLCRGASAATRCEEQDLFQDWSRVNGGHYTHLCSARARWRSPSTAPPRCCDAGLPPTRSRSASTYREAPGPGSSQGRLERRVATGIAAAGRRRRAHPRRFGLDAQADGRQAPHRHRQRGS